MLKRTHCYRAPEDISRRVQRDLVKPLRKLSCKITEYAPRRTLQAPRAQQGRSRSEASRRCEQLSSATRQQLRADYMIGRSVSRSARTNHLVFSALCSVCASAHQQYVLTSAATCRPPVVNLSGCVKLWRFLLQHRLCLQQEAQPKISNKIVSCRWFTS